MTRLLLAFDATDRHLRRVESLVESVQLRSQSERARASIFNNFLPVLLVALRALSERENSR